MRNGLWSRAAGWTVVAGMSLAGVALAAAPPVIPGYNRLKEESKASPADLGQVLLGELNCTQCHAAPEAKRVLTKGAPDLSDAGARLTSTYIRKYLSDPHGIKPGNTMPDLFHASDPAAKEGAVDYLTHYLVSLGGPIKPATDEGDVSLVEEGRRLYLSVGCVACHAVEKGSGPMKVPSVPLPTNLAEKTTVNGLEAFLLDPIKVRPGSRMPSSGLSQDEAHALAVYLLKEQLENPQVANAEPPKVTGVQAEYYEQEVNSCALETIGQLKPKLKGKIKYFGINVSGRRNENFAMKFTAVLKVPRLGKYTFHTLSDDGSRLYVDSKLVVDNDGVHAPTEKSGEIELSEGDHPIIVTFFQGGGGSELRVDWEGPGLKREQIPSSALYFAAGRPMVPVNSEKFTVDPQKTQAGGRMFAAMGCASCHGLPNVESQRKAKALAQLNVESDTGCLGAHVAKGLPNYELSDDQRQSLKAALADKGELDKPFEPAEQVVHTMAALNCFACHRRGSIGGPAADRVDYFKMTSEFDMGEEGKIPPLLNFVGEKLKPEAMEQIIFEGKLHVRPVMATRMPMFGKAALGSVVDAFQKADAREEATAAAFSDVAAKEGRTLVGTKGLGCVNCHGMNGTKSLGMPAPDLGTVSERIKYGWFHRWLDNPPALVPGTRMPQFWPQHEAALKNIAGGTEEGQINATWAYLSLGKSMILPTGLLPTTGYELIPADGPIVHRTFMSDVGPRAIAVGFPEMVHVAFDANGVKLAEAWRGRFFDARGMWESRGGNWMGPLGTDVLKMPPGPALAVLDRADAPWPELQMGGRDEKFRNVGGHFKGYELDKAERPTFHYVLNDTIDVHEQPLPVQRNAHADLVRKFDVASPKPVENLYFLAASGQKIEGKSPGVWTVDDGKLTVTLSPADKLKPVVRDSNGQKQLLVPVHPENGAAHFEVEMSW